MYTTSTQPRRRKPLSDRAVRVLRAVCFTERKPNDLAPLLEACDGSWSNLGSVIAVLSERWLIVYEGQYVRPRQRGVELLRTAAYRNRGLE